MTHGVFETFLSTPEMSAVFGEASLLQAMLDFEAALARAQADEGLIPAPAADAIARAAQVSRLDTHAVLAQSARAGSVALPLVKALTEAVARDDAAAAGFVHWGSTSQDVIDTGMALATRCALALIDRDLARLVRALLALADAHADAPLLARTLMQPAQVSCFGYKLAQWTAPLVRCRSRLHVAGRAALKLQLGGAAGTLSAMGERGDAVARRMARSLGLAPAPMAWHTQRDETVALGAEVGVLVGALGKVALDVALLAQAEVAELAEPSGAGRGGSSAMPHKRNPVGAMVALAAAQRAPQRVAALLSAMPQQHERGLGNWQAELAEWVGLFMSAHGAVQALAEAAEGLLVDAPRMRANIEALLGLVCAEAAGTVLARALGKPGAHALMETLSRDALAQRRPLADVVREAVQRDAAVRARVDLASLDLAFDIERAADPARRVAHAQLAALRAQAVALDTGAPWTAHLPKE